MTTVLERRNALAALLKKRIAILDGAETVGDHN